MAVVEGGPTKPHTKPHTDPHTKLHTKLDTKLHIHSRGPPDCDREVHRLAADEGAVFGHAHLVQTRRTRIKLYPDVALQNLQIVVPSFNASTSPQTLIEPVEPTRLKGQRALVVIHLAPSIRTLLWQRARSNPLQSPPCLLNVRPSLYSLPQKRPPPRLSNRQKVSTRYQVLKQERCLHILCRKPRELQWTRWKLNNPLLRPTTPCHLTRLIAKYRLTPVKRR